MKIVVLGLSITSSWGNGHATTYRGLVRELARQGHNVWFLERNKPWYAQHRDLNHVPGCEIYLYESIFELRERFGDTIEDADAVIVGSYVPEGIAVGEWVTCIASGVTAFYDIDTPVTVEALRGNVCAYLTEELVGAYDLYLSFTGGPMLESLERIYGARHTAPLYCSVDPELYFPEDVERRWELGYLGTYAADRQSALEELLLELAKEIEDRFVVAGPQYPKTIAWPQNVDRIQHLAPAAHRLFYSQQRFTLNLTRAAMITAGYSPSVRLFEAAACGVPIISDRWLGIETFFVPGEEILLADRAAEVTAMLRQYSEDESLEIGRRARKRVLLAHTAAHRAHEFEELIQRVAKSKRGVLQETIS
jgi:spore maturation protein CgeB